MLLPNANSGENDYLAERFFTNKEVRRKVGKILLEAGLNKSSIDAEAFPPLDRRPDENRPTLD